MDDRLIPVSLAQAKATIAGAMVGDEPESIVVGTITLRPHQRDAVRQIRTLLATRGGALLADRVGMGKTYVALALARDRKSVIVCPAAIRATWEQAMTASKVLAPMITHEALSRTPGPSVGEPELVIVDEAHHARNPATTRYRRLAALCTRAKVLLLSGTPVHNHHRDLCALLALFLGTRAWSLPDAELLECVIRRDDRIPDVAASARPPAIDPSRVLQPPDDPLSPEELMALPPPVPPRDGGRAESLLSLALMHRWASSRAALRGMLRRRLTRAIAIASALESGRHLTRRELARWVVDTDVLQLGFAELLAEPAGSERATLLDAVHAHIAAVRALCARIGDGPDPDDARTQLLRELRTVHRGERIIAFTQFAETAAAYWQRLRTEPNVAMLTAAGGRIAGGASSRAEILQRFAPVAQGAPQPPPRERIDLLVTTDLLSEGLNLQDASVVVHLDQPWTPARLEQRVGRVARPGAPHARVAVYRLAAPAAAERVTHIHHRLAEKLRQAGRTVGLAGSIHPIMAADDESVAATAPAVAQQMLRMSLVRWRNTPTGSSPPAEAHTARIACARGDAEAWVALVRAGDTHRLVAKWTGVISTAPWALLEACAAISRAAPSEEPIPGSLAAMNELRGWLRHRDAAACIDLGLAAERRERRRVLARIGKITGRVPFHRRAAIIPLATAARRAASAPYAFGAQLVLGELARAPMEDEAWLRSLVAFAEANARHAPDSSGPVSELVVALIVVTSAP